MLNVRPRWLRSDFYTVQVKLLARENFNAAAATMRAKGEGAIIQTKLGLAGLALQAGGYAHKVKLRTSAQGSLADNVPIKLDGVIYKGGKLAQHEV